MTNQKNSVSNNQTMPSRLYLTKMFRTKQELTIEVLVNTVWVSTFLALMLTVPSLVIFMGIFFATGNILLGVVIGFGLHFVGLAYSEKISKGLLRTVS
ncbi:MAG TPA: hypothetical protein VD699_01540 [Nitrosopumilaceae archaeon]|nr:hypothetical protein [Nitrosopumilaceae archaeon]